MKIIQSKYKVKVPVLTLIFKSFVCIVLYLSRRYFNISSYFVRIVPYYIHSSFEASVLLFVVPSTLNEESIIASNLANRALWSFSSFFCSIIIYDVVGSITLSTIILLSYFSIIV